MTKSEDSDYSRINLKDDKDLIDQKIRKAKTDDAPIPSEINGLKNRNEATNLLSIYASVNDMEVSKVLQEFGGKNFSTGNDLEKFANVTDMKKFIEQLNYNMRVTCVNNVLTLAKSIKPIVVVVRGW